MYMNTYEKTEKKKLETCSLFIYLFIYLFFPIIKKIIIIRMKGKELCAEGLAKCIKTRLDQSISIQNKTKEIYENDPHVYP